MSISVSIRLPEDLAKRLDHVVKNTDRSRSYLMQKALEAYLEEQADFQIALDRLHDSSDPVISLDDMRKELEL